MQAIPIEVREYLSTNDSLVRAQISQRYPNLSDILDSPSTRAAVLAWLGSNEAWEDSLIHFTINSLKYMQGKASTDESQTIRAFLLHPHPQVRLAAYENLLTLYFPDKNPEALMQLLQNMLSDNDEMLRVEAAHYVKQSGVAAELKGFLQRWRQMGVAPENSESRELVDGLLSDG
jgi:hypothetical protein